MATFQFSLAPLFWARLNDANGLLSAGPLRRPRPGEPHRHVTIPMAPDRRKRFRPHLTVQRPGRDKKDHEFLLDVPFEDWLALFREFERDMSMAFLAALCPVTLEELTDLGYFVCLMPEPDVLARELRPHFDLRGKQLSVKWSDALVIDFMVCLLHYAVDPVQLTPEHAQAYPLPLIGLHDGVMDSRLLMYFHQPVGIGENPGWYTLPMDALSFDVGIRAFVRVLGHEFFDAMEYAMTEFGQPPSGPQWEDLKRRVG
jgi:hypothetical protein